MQVEVSVQDLSRGNQAYDGAEGYSPAADVDASVAAIDWQRWFQVWLETLRPAFSPIQAYELCLRLTSDAEIQNLNAQYRHQDRPTDVLAFAALEVDVPSAAVSVGLPVYLGDIVVSVDTARRQAKDHRHSLEQELAWLAVHGLLHLLGWDHPNDESLIQMLEQQRVLLKTVGFTFGDQLSF